VKHFALSISEFLLAQGAQILVFACNTSSAYALGEARRRFEEPVFGMIEPGARAAVNVTQNHKIGVLATHATVESCVYTQTIQAMQPRAAVWEIACPLFVPLVESEQTASRAAREAAETYLRPLLDADVDTVVLGCTHYPLLLPVLNEVAPQITFVDPAEILAGEIAARVKPPPHTKYFEDDKFFVSGPQDGVHNWIEKLLPQSRGEVLAGPVFDMVVS
jgi:glutamate racemase